MKFDLKTNLRMYGVSIVAIILFFVAANWLRSYNAHAMIQSPLKAINTEDPFAFGKVFPLQFTLQAQTNCVMSGETVHLELEVTNLTNRDLTFTPPFNVSIHLFAFISDPLELDWPIPPAEPVLLDQLAAGASQRYTWDWVAPPLDEDRRPSSADELSITASLSRHTALPLLPDDIAEGNFFVDLDPVHLNVVYANGRKYPCTELR